MAALAQRSFSDLLTSCHPWSSPRKGLNLLCSSWVPPPQMEHLEAFLLPAPWELLPELGTARQVPGLSAAKLLELGTQTG